MKVSGFTFVRNAIKYDYPVVESINSVLPLVDEMIVAVGQSDDDTRNLILNIKSGKIKIIDTLWDDSKRESGVVLADETNKAFDATYSESTWAVYIQADEVIHEDYIPVIQAAMNFYASHKEIEALVFNYTHFYGSYDFYGDSRNWYRREIRIIRNDKSIRSYRDAQGFRKNGRPLVAGIVPATVFHYGWVKPPEFQKAKLGYFHTLWHDEEWMRKKQDEISNFDYSGISVARFTGKHPKVMEERIAQKNWTFNVDPSHNKVNLITRILHLFERMTGKRIGEYKNYRIHKKILFRG